MDNMEALGITVGDITVVGILGIAALMGTALGLVKAVLFVASWAGARVPISLIRACLFLEHINTKNC